MNERIEPQDASGGRPQMGAEILPLVYADLRRLAAQRLAQEPEKRNQEATELVHEAWLRLAGRKDREWQSRGHFFVAASRTIRRILIEKVRHDRRLKHAGDQESKRTSPVDLPCSSPDEDLLALDEALHELFEADPLVANLVQLRFFGGLSQAQAAEVLRISRSTADRLWAFARAWLFQRIRGNCQ